MNYLLSEIARIVGGEHRGCDLRVKEVATDSRGVMSSDDMVFVAINGKNHDGHNYIPQMVVRGVRAFITERPVDVAELSEFEECGACGTGAIITPLGNVFDPDSGEKIHYGDEVGPVLLDLYKSLQDVQYGRVPDIHNWCVVVE